RCGRAIAGGSRGGCEPVARTTGFEAGGGTTARRVAGERTRFGRVVVSRCCGVLLERSRRCRPPRCRDHLLSDRYQRGPSSDDPPHRYFAFLRPCEAV